MASRQKLRFSAEHVKLMRDQFKLVDSDGDKLLDEEEFRKLFRSFGQTVSNKRLDSIVQEEFKELGAQGGMDFETFMKAFVKYYSPPPTEKALVEAFQLFDDDTGYLDKSKLFTLLSTRGEKLSKSELDQFSKLMGLDGVSKVDYRKLSEDMRSLLTQVTTSE